MRDATSLEQRLKLVIGEMRSPITDNDFWDSEPREYILLNKLKNYLVIIGSGGYCFDPF